MDSRDIRTVVSLGMQSWWGRTAEPQSCVTFQAEELPRAAQSSPSVYNHRNSYLAILPVRCPFSRSGFVDNPLILLMIRLLIVDAIHEVGSRDR